MNTKQIDFVALDRTVSRSDFKEAFELRTDRPAVWLQKTCFYVLRKLGAFYLKDTVTVNRHLIDANSFMERLYKQKESVFRHFNVNTKTLLIGSEDYAELMHEPAINRMVSFGAEFNHNRTILGLTVTIVPWMRGILVMP